MLFLQGHLIAQTTYHESVYGIEFHEPATLSAKSFVQSMLMANIKYTIRSNDSLYSITTGGTVKSNSEHIHTQISGPQNIYFNIKKDLVKFDDSASAAYRFKQVHFKKVQLDTVINGYRCELIVSPKNDSIYISDQLSWHINPFILTSKSINGGIVKAVMANHTIYTLEDVKLVSGGVFPEAMFSRLEMVKPSDNLFFK